MILDKLNDLGIDLHFTTEQVKSWFMYNPESPLLFNSTLFLCFFTVFYLLYIATKKHIHFRNVYVLLFSLFFYYKAGGLFFVLLIFSCIANYLLSGFMHKTENKSERKILLVFIICLNLFLLGYFKYTNFLIENINLLCKHINIFDGNFSPQDIILPIGISFFTFQAISYTVDLYKKEIEPSRNILEFSFYLCFFPQLVAGPIVRAKEFIPQIRQSVSLTNKNAGLALFMIMSGLIKKAVISDYISYNFVDRIFDSPLSYTSFENLMASYGYALQIYCDFSGYSDMAIGLALLMGFTLPQNFNSPYKSTSITEFWRRWHISLSSWLRDYLYIPLGGNRKGKIRTYVNLFLTMIIGGLWHGSAWKFVTWGALHGVILVIEKILRQYIKLPKNYFVSFVSLLLTFHFVAFCWIFFRAATFDDAISVITQIGDLNFELDEWLIIIDSYRNVFILILIGFALHFCPEKISNYTQYIFEKTPLIGKSLIIGLVFWLVYATASSDTQPFIYFQF